MYPSWTLETCSTFFLVLLALLFTSGNLAIRLIRKRDRLGSHGEMDYINQFQLPSNAQANSPLFDGTIPGEIRDRIFAFTLSCFESQKAWDRDSSYVRPEYAAPLVADTAILQTCQRAYVENWFRPWISATHTFYLAWEGRRPDKVTTVEKFEPTLELLFATHGETEISHVRVFAQLCSLENGRELSRILGMKNFFPQKITITIRHHDWWSWEEDARLHIGSQWVRDCRFPDTVREICVELESLQRKKDQIDWIAGEMAQGWQFARCDGTKLSAKPQDVRVSRWSGSSTWEGHRWLRDETKPGVNEYYVKTITWKPDPSMTERPVPKSLRAPNSFGILRHRNPSMPVSRIRGAGVPEGLSAEETEKLVRRWEGANR
ncbi:hypothetical protein H2204_009316 [Knufia peltigerae]|uniref:Uncharacterized protein n=1 Tax=Knufia peltigerae TaxID=1002370 RepID=A0AA39CW15_9EURO|nr:hypothetical protein H2204_009316 [Knufia peltigerae]